MTRPSERIIRASQVGAYAYCAHAWWLGVVEGVPPEDAGRLESGTAAHERHGRQVLRAIVLARLAQLLFLLAGLAAVVWLISELVS